MSLIDYIKSIFSGESRKENGQCIEAADEKPVTTECPIDKNPTLENVARFVVSTQRGKGADIQRYFGIGYKLAGRLMSQLQQKGIIDSNNNVLIKADISDAELGQLLNHEIPEVEDIHHTISVSGFEIRTFSTSCPDKESTIKPYISGLSKYEYYIVFDTETSGLSPQQGHEILQIGAVKYDTKTGEAADTLSIYIKPSSHCVIEPSALRVNGIDIEEVRRTGLSKSEAINTFVEFISSYPLFAYNAPFDMRFLKSTCEAAGIALPSNPVCDVLAMVRQLSLPTENKKLATICAHFGYRKDNTMKPKEIVTLPISQFVRCILTSKAKLLAKLLMIYI